MIDIEDIRMMVVQVMVGTVIPRYNELLSGRMNMGGAEIVSQTEQGFVVQVPIFPPANERPSHVSYIGARRCRLSIKCVWLHFKLKGNESVLSDHEIIHSELASDNDW